MSPRETRAERDERESRRTLVCNGPLCNGERHLVSRFRYEHTNPKTLVRTYHRICIRCEAEEAKVRAARRRADPAKGALLRQDQERAHARRRAATRLTEEHLEEFRTYYAENLVAMGYSKGEAKAWAKAYTLKGSNKRVKNTTEKSPCSRCGRLYGMGGPVKSHERHCPGRKCKQCPHREDHHLNARSCGAKDGRYPDGVCTCPGFA